MIRTAKSEENEELSSLAVRSKAHWNYDADFLEACRQDLTYTQQDISHHTVYVVEEMGQVVGFYRLEIRENELELSDLFIEPSKIGQGYGKRLWDYAIDRARQLGFHNMTDRLTMPSHYVKAGVAGVILRGNQIVMVRRKYGTNKGKWCIPCGNVEVGEDVRTAVRREIKEETGLDVTLILSPYK